MTLWILPLGHQGMSTPDSLIILTLGTGFTPTAGAHTPLLAATISTHTLLCKNHQEMSENNLSNYTQIHIQEIIKVQYTAVRMALNSSAERLHVVQKVDAI